MQIKSALFVFIAFLWPSLTLSTVNICNDDQYTVINDPMRSVANKKQPSDRLCDKKIIDENKWYRFTSEAGGEIATTKPELKRCGTQMPLWMNGSHPSVEDLEVSRKGCDRTRCGHFTIRVRNCSGFYIYKLWKPKDCFSAYCVGSKVPNCTDCLKNRRPYFNMSKELYTYEGMNLQFRINATDPEGYLLEYEIVDTNTCNNVTISQDYVTINQTRSCSITLRAKDVVVPDNTVITTIKINAVPCRCQNNGNCVGKRNISWSTNSDDISSYECRCVKSYTGRRCEKSPCDDFPCFAGVRCNPTDDYFTCETCPRMFEGDGTYCKINKGVKVSAQLTIVSGLEWRTDLLNNKSRHYKNETNKVVNEIKNIYKNTDEFVHVVVLEYSSKGSVVVKFQIILKRKMERPLEPLINSLKVNNGKMGSYKLIIPKEPSPNDPDDPLYCGLNKGTFVTLVCIVPILFLVTVILFGMYIKMRKERIFLCWKCKRRRRIAPENRNGQA